MYLLQRILKVGDHHLMIFQADAYIVSISMDSGMSFNLKEYHLQCSKLRYQFLGNFTFTFYLRTYLNVYIYIHTGTCIHACI